jgi:two-component system response regulator AtoC/two-component system response regulator HupR/HoxA
MLAKHARHDGRAPYVLSPEAEEKLVAYGWPGNVHELANVIERATILSPGETVRGDDIVMPPAERSTLVARPFGHWDEARVDLPTQLDDMERRELCAALERCEGNKAEVARMLGIQRTTLYYRLKRLGIEV